MTRPWHETDAFWADFREVLFPDLRWERVGEEVDGLLRLADLPPGSRILDLCCGPGRHSLELARRGHRVVGVDRTAAYLEEAREEARRERLAVEFLQDDMRRYRSPETFDAALNLFTSFGYFEDPAEDRLVAEHLFASLRPGGILIMEMVGREVVARTFRERDWRRLERPEGAILLEERTLTGGWGWIENEWTVIEAEKRTTHRFAHRLYCGTELAALLGSVGFDPVDLHGGLDGRPYDHQAVRLVAAARKPSRGGAG